METFFVRLQKFERDGLISFRRKIRKFKQRQRVYYASFALGRGVVRELRPYKFTCIILYTHTHKYERFLQRGT